jgi:curved DNA-binding protein CbpA
VLSYYDVLSVDPSAELDTIRRAWRLKVRLLHPDRHRDSPGDVQAEAARETLRVNKAWDTLRDPTKRHEYDDYLLGFRDVEVGRDRADRDRADRADGSDPAPDDVDSPRREWRSAHNYLSIASFVIVIMAAGFVVAGAVLLARLTQ